MNKPSRGLFITFEGGEGAGKTTLIRRIERDLNERHIPYVVTREPGGTPLGEHIRQLLLHHENMAIAPLSELLLFLTARSQHIDELIRPALNSGAVVLCDRYNDSTVAYQGIARGMGQGYVQQLCDMICGDVKPDLTFYLDVDPRVGMERAAKQQRVLDRMEQEKVEFHEKVRQGFLQIAAQDKTRVTVIDASQEQDKVYEQALTVVKQFFTGWTGLGAG